MMLGPLPGLYRRSSASSLMELPNECDICSSSATVLVVQRDCKKGALEVLFIAIDPVELWRRKNAGRGHLRCSISLTRSQGWGMGSWSGVNRIPAARRDEAGAIAFATSRRVDGLDWSDDDLLS